jgi:hypothetical protein
MSANQLVAEIENELRAIATALTNPHEGECLLCYVRRMLEFGCIGLRWARHYRDLRAPRATALEARLGRKGGFCDCEVFMNGFELAPEHWVPAQEYVEGGVTYQGDPSYPDPFPACTRVGAGSTQGCALWVPRRRGW